MPRLDQHFVHLGLGAKAVVEPEFTGMNWYAGYAERHDSADGSEGRLVSMYRFDSNWDAWEMHPRGDEVVICTEGAMVLIQQHADGNEERIELRAGDYAINPAGVWHTADVTDPATAIFVTAGKDTEHRPR
ncbi:MAG: cupin domain-containing protein [Pseudomonadota bacterium]